MLSRCCQPRGIVKYACCTALSTKQKHRYYTSINLEPDPRIEIVTNIAALKKQIAENDRTIANLTANLKQYESNDTQPEKIDLDDAEIKLFVSEHVFNIRTRLKRKFATKAIADVLLKDQYEAFGEQEIFVTGLPEETTHYDIYKHFGGFSQVLLVNLLRKRIRGGEMTHPGPLTGNAFIKMNSPEIADDAINRLDNSLFLGSRLSVVRKLQEQSDREALQDMEDINSIQDGRSSKWTCESCSFLNFARNSTCQECGDDRVMKPALFNSDVDVEDTEGNY